MITKEEHEALSNDLYAYVDSKLLRMFVLDGFCCEVVSDIISHELSRLDAADEVLSEYGITRTEEWKNAGRYYMARAARG